MKFLVALSFCFLTLLSKGSCFFSQIPSEKLDDDETLLKKISGKFDELVEYFDNQPSLSVLYENVKNIDKNLQKYSSSHDLESPLESLSRLEKKISSLESKLDNVLNPASIGNSIKSLERKLAKLQFSLDRSLIKSEYYSMKPSSENSNYEINNILIEIASKLNALYEKSEIDDVTILDRPEGRNLGKSCKMLAVPYKRLLSSVDHLQKAVRDLGENKGNAIGEELRNSAMSDIRDRLENILDEIQLLRRRNEKNINENERILRRIDKKLDSELEDDDEDDEKLKKSLKKYMVEQRRTLEKNLKKLLKNKNDDDDDDSDDDDSDDDNNGNRKKSRKNNDSDDDDEDDDDDDDDNDKDDNSDDDDDNDDDDEIVCDDSDENGSKSCEKEKKKGILKRKKKSKYANISDIDDDYDNDDFDVKKKKFGKKKVKKSIKESVKAHDLSDNLIADQPYESLPVNLAVLPPESSQSQKKIPDVTPV